MGSMFGGCLAAHGYEVTLVDIFAAHIDQIAEAGLVVERPGMEPLRSHPRAVLAGQAAAEVDYAIVLTKAFATEAAAESIEQMFPRETAVLTLQNGIGNDGMLASRLGGGRVAVGLTTAGAEFVSPGVVRMATSTAAGGSMTSVGRGETTAWTDDQFETLAKALGDSGLPVKVSASIDVDVWTKVAMAGTVSPLCSVLGIRIDRMMSDDHSRETLHKLILETVEVARAGGTHLDPQETWTEISGFLSRGNEHMPSMAVDLREGRRTEVDALCGEVVRLGRERGVPTPHLETIDALVRVLERVRSEEAGVNQH
jgi:2-dehydropantoate 2-reductase